MIDPFKVFDYVDGSSDGKFTLVGFDDISLIWIHRIGPGIGLSAPEISNFFQTEGAKYTGGNMAYTFVNTPGLDGQVQQALPLNERGAHARRWGNMHGIGFAQIGDFRHVAPHNAQWDRAVDLCARIIPWLAPHARSMSLKLPEHLRHELPIVGHGEVPGSFGETSGKDQPFGSDACPGEHWDMDLFRAEVRRIIVERAALDMTTTGVRFAKT